MRACDGACGEPFYEFDGDVMDRRITDALRELADTASRTAEVLAADVARAAEMFRETVRGGGTLFFCGNGGSAADAQHLATEFVSTLTVDHPRPSIPAVALTTDTSLLTGPSGPTNDSTPTFTFSSGDSGATFECKLDGPGATTEGRP